MVRTLPRPSILILPPCLIIFFTREDSEQGSHIGLYEEMPNLKEKGEGVYPPVFSL